MDHSSWLRPLIRTRAQAQAQPSSSDRVDDNQEAEDLPPRYRPARASSYLSIRSEASSLPPSQPEPFPHYRAPENLYHRPSGDQMAEELKVVMMRNPTLQPVPVQYNSCILHVLEAYHDLQEQLQTKDQGTFQIYLHRLCFPLFIMIFKACLANQC